MQLKSILAFGAASLPLAIGIATPAMAQSTGTIETDEKPAIVVTGARVKDGVGGFVAPDSTKSRGVITQELIERQGAGQSILNTINQIPGVNFTNSDAYGSSGGNLRIRGFDGNRISLTFDGFPLNDSGNYAIFSNQQLDAELIEQVNVNLGTTDIDSPTASAAGGTVNYRTIVPSHSVGARLSATFGTYNYRRIFGMIQSGDLTSSGLRMFVSASNARNDKFKGPGEIYKQQYNARIYQPIGSNGDFVSLAGHYNQNRNAFYRNPSVSDMRTLFAASTVTIPSTNAISAATPLDLSTLPSAQTQSLFAFENDANCTQPNAVGGTAQNYGAAGVTCTNFYGLRINPSNTGNFRFNSRFTLADNLIFTADASWQYVLANGGGYTTLAENSALAKGSNTTGPGVDFNKDGDFLDTVGFYTPNNTNTRRFTAITSLVYTPAEGQTIQLSYTFDRARHRQTGEWGYLGANGLPFDVFGGRNSGGVFASDGFKLQQRDRTSIALLNQVSGKYVGKFMEDKLRVEVGIRAPFFHRELTNNCYTQTSGSGFATCTSQPVTALTIVPATQVAPFPAGSFYAPFNAKYNFHQLLPSAGFSYKLTDAASLSANWSKGFSAPRTDNLYRQPLVTIDPETTDAFDLNLRYSTTTLQAQVSGWLINFKNRIVTSFDAVQGISVDRNVGRVQGYGIDAGFAWRPSPLITLFGNASYNHSELKDNILLGNSTSLPLTQIFAPTAGKRVSETPTWTVGGRAQVNLDPISLGIQAKHVTSRFATDVNDVISPAYDLVDLDVRFSMAKWGFKKAYLQLNVDNLFDKFYFGNISTQINAGNICPTGSTCAANSANPNFSIGSPRTIRASINLGF